MSDWLRHPSLELATLDLLRWACLGFAVCLLIRATALLLRTAMSSEGVRRRWLPRSGALTRLALTLAGASLGPGGLVGTSGTALADDSEPPANRDRLADELTTLTPLGPPPTERTVPHRRLTLPHARPMTPIPRSTVRDTWLVETGDHLWAIAAETLADAAGEPPSEADISCYWQQLLAANRSKLVDPDQPDFIVPGQLLELPPVTGSGSGSAAAE